MTGFEENLSAEPPAPSQDAWFPGAHENAGRPPNIETPAPEGPPPPDSMKASSAPQAFPKILRVLRRAEFRRVYEEGQRRSGPLCALFFRSNGLPYTRLGITASARLGNAVLRNRVKRRLREAFRLNRELVPGGWDIVVNPREAAARVPFATLVKELLRLFPNQPPASSVEPQ